MRKKILIVSETKIFYKIFEAVLSDKYDAEHAFNTAEALRALRRGKFDMLLVSEKIEKGSCFDLMSQIRKGDIKFRNIPSMFLAQNITSAFVMSANRLNVDDAEKLPIEPSEFLSKLDSVLQKHAKPYQRPEPITGLSRKLFAEEEISDMLNNGRRGTLFLIELDRYSFVGSAVSKNTLLQARDALKNMLPGSIGTDSEAILAVSAGSGFLIFVPDMRDKKTIEDYAAALIRAIKMAVDSENGSPIFISIGLAVTDRHGTNYSDLYKMCDLGLSRARTSGKNKAFFYKW